MPPDHELPDRLGAVLAVLYLVFNEGYGPPPRDELCDEAIRLAKIASVLMPDEPELFGLLALMLFHDSRRRRADRGRRRRSCCSTTRTARSGTRAGSPRAGACSSARRGTAGRGPYQLQAAIAGAHAQEAPDWSLVASLYGRLARVARRRWSS